MLLLKYEKAVMVEIESWLSGQQSYMQDSLLTLVRKGAECLLATTPAGQGGTIHPPYCPAEVAFTLLAHKRRQGDTMLQCGQTMVLHILSKYRAYTLSIVL